MTFEHGEQLLAQILVPPLPEPFTYEVPGELRNKIDMGFRVEIPFGRRKTFGYIVKIGQTVSRPDGITSLKTIVGVDGNFRHFAPAQLEFFRWVAGYYGDSLSSVLEVAIPPSLPQRYDRTVLLVQGGPTPEKPGKLQQKILEFLREHQGSANFSEVSRKVRGASAALKALEEKGTIKILSQEALDSHVDRNEPATWAKKEVTLNPSQTESLKQIDEARAASGFVPFLLHGVTGSGKTEVYIEAAQKALQAEKGALIIVPEIALTPQLIDRFRARLGPNIAVLHSALNRRVRWDSWRALLEGRSKIAIGARSAIFAPVPDLGLIVVDEEHDSSYKQSEGLRYHARDLALVRGKLEHCPVVLGSATPSLETYYNAMRKKYVYQRLPASHSTAAASHVEIVDLSQVKPWEMKSKSISPQLFAALHQAVTKGEQAFILYNRRGFATYLQCDRCNKVVECPNCSVALTFHRESNSLLCHYCSFSLVPPHFCSHCETSKKTEAPKSVRPGKKPEPEGIYVQRGAGTERIVEEIKELFPDIPLDRLDRDTALDGDAYRQILDRMRSGETQILVGTQMIAKGHDLPGVTLVGIVDCDVGLHLPDFRASERIFQLLTQAAGRAGRGSKPGVILLQTRVPLHPSLIKTVEKDYEGFARGELRQRKEVSYPPYSRMLRILVSSPEQTFPMRILESFKVHAQEAVRSQQLAVTLLGPSPAPLQRLKAQWRAHLICKSTSVAALHKVQQTLAALKIHTGKVRIVFDLDPQEML